MLGQVTAKTKQAWKNHDERHGHLEKRKPMIGAIFARADVLGRTGNALHQQENPWSNNPSLAPRPKAPNTMPVPSACPMGIILKAAERGPDMRVILTGKNSAELRATIPFHPPVFDNPRDGNGAGAPKPDQEKLQRDFVEYCRKRRPPAATIQGPPSTDEHPNALKLIFQPSTTFNYERPSRTYFTPDIRTVMMAKGDGGSTRWPRNHSAVGDTPEQSASSKCSRNGNHHDT